MRNSRKIASLVLAGVLAFSSMGMTAFADSVSETQAQNESAADNAENNAETNSFTITINHSAEGHTYQAYQIFKGDLSGTTLSNIEWGDGVTETGQNELGSATTNAASLKETADAEKFAKTVAEYLYKDNAKESSYSSENKNYTITGLSAGYYLVKDMDNSLVNNGIPLDEAYTSYIMEVVGSVEVTPKSGTPTVEKKVRDINSSTDSDIDDNDWQDSADFAVGDHIPFQLTATLADNVSAYETYELVFNDTLSKGLTYDNNAVVSVGDNELNKSEYTLGTETDSSTGVTKLTIRIANVKAEKVNAGNKSVITVNYTATLNENAVIGSDGNTNKVNLEYSNNPNGDQKGKTPDDTVIVFTYKVVVNKVDQNEKALAGAGFTLYKMVKTPENTENTETTEDSWTKVKEMEAGDTTTFTFSGLDDGQYKLVESTTPAGYNTIAPIEFTITAEHEVKSDAPELKSLTGTGSSETITFTSSASEGSLTTTVVNNAGATLPSTGGMGTTIFYVLGSILVIGAAVLLIVKKRMSAEEQE